MNSKSKKKDPTSLPKKNPPLQALREVPELSSFSDNDSLVIFGEVFQKGYVNGLIHEAKKRGLQIVYSTVGRREPNSSSLRPLSQEELKEKEAPLINIPLEAGFDLEKSSKGNSPVDFLQTLKLKNWDQKNILDWDQIEESRKKGEARFREKTSLYLLELENILSQKTGHVIFVHTMAGGFPRAKVVMPAANRVFKGYQNRYLSSEHFWNTDIGQLCEMSFEDVTAKSFHHLIDLSTSLREKLENQGRKVTYLAYGYHGTEVLVQDEYRWQSYSPYLQGWAKLSLEKIARQAWQKGIKATVFNSPEILTSSSHIFLGVEVSLYPLLKALKKEILDPDAPFFLPKNPKEKENITTKLQHFLKTCENLLKEDFTIENLFEKTNHYFSSETMKKWSYFEKWPQHNGPQQMELMRQSSSELIDMHHNKKQLITNLLSELVFSSSGYTMLHSSWEPQAPVLWLGHDLIAKVSSVSSYLQKM